MKIKNIATLIFLVCLITNIVFSISAQPPPFACDSSNSATQSYPFCDKNLPVKDRAKDLVMRLKLGEKVEQLVNGASAIPRLGIPAYEWWVEGLHGVSQHGKATRFNGTIHSATQFPQIILSAASFDSKIWYEVAKYWWYEADCDGLVRELGRYNWYDGCYLDDVCTDKPRRTVYPTCLNREQCNDPDFHRKILY